jgi:hypothetical protein
VYKGGKDRVNGEGDETGKRQQTGREQAEKWGRKRGKQGEQAETGKRQQAGREQAEKGSRQRGKQGNRQRQRIQIRSSQRDIYKGGEQVETDKETSNKMMEMVEVGKQATAAREIYLVLVSESFVRDCSKKSYDFLRCGSAAYDGTR